MYKLLIKVHIEVKDTISLPSEYACVKRIRTIILLLLLIIIYLINSCIILNVWFANTGNVICYQYGILPVKQSAKRRKCSPPQMFLAACSSTAFRRRPSSIALSLFVTCRSATKTDCPLVCASKMAVV